MVRIVGCIPFFHKRNRDKLSEIERLARDSGADVLVLPEEYFGGPRFMGGRYRMQAYHPLSKLRWNLARIAREHKVGLVVGLIEKIRRRNHQSLWFFDEKGRYLGSERKCNLAGYELDPSFYGLSKNQLRNLRKRVFKIKGTKGVGILCWEVHDLHMKLACDSAQAHWIADCIKFPINYFPIYEKREGRYKIKGLARSEPGYEEWIEKLRGISRETLSLVVASCNPNFSGLEELLPRDAKPLACIVHPDPRRGKNGIVALTHTPGECASLEFDPYEIELLREGRTRYEKVFGERSFPPGIEATGKAWRVRHLYEKRRVEIRRTI
jgi:predicted amidohydrolase